MKGVTSSTTEASNAKQGEREKGLTASTRVKSFGELSECVSSCSFRDSMVRLLVLKCQTQARLCTRFSSNFPSTPANTDQSPEEGEAGGEGGGVASRDPK